MATINSNNNNGKAADFLSDESGGEDFDHDPEITLASIKPLEAFRELLQNWRDAIIKSFGLDEKDFHVFREEKTRGSDTEVVYKVLRFDDSDEKQCLGYLRFKSRDGAGTIELINRAATLQPWHLDLGGTSKASDNKQAGAHGEGMKIALLVLMRGRQNHMVSCRSGGFDWRFAFTTRGRLVARLSRMSHKSMSNAVNQARRLSERTLVPFAGAPDGDVQFVIGEQKKGRNERGDMVTRSPVQRCDFDAWTKAALFLHSTDNGAIISAAKGDLLTSQYLRGSVYLKGLLLRESSSGHSASITTFPFRFGYNFAFGSTNRERQSVGDAEEESRSIHDIWSCVLDAQPGMVRELSDMLNDPQSSQIAEVCGSRKHLTRSMASRLKKYPVGDEFAGRWYYCAEDASNNPRLKHVIQGLGCKGFQLTKTYWTILRRYQLVRTAEEEECRRFTMADANNPEIALRTPVIDDPAISDQAINDSAVNIPNVNNTAFKPRAVRNPGTNSPA
ncbi:hypothetical protein B0T26DRAFT_876620, partial [Lasiosphaeria miniovina]